MKPLAYLLVLGGLLAISACEPMGSPESQAEPTNLPVSNTSPASVTRSPTSSRVLSPTLNSATPAVNSTPSPAAENMVKLSVQDLSQRLGLSTNQISVKNVTPVTWRDASLGCPKPSIDYIRVETPGYSLTLEAKGQEYTYHTDLAKRLILCAAQGPFEIYPTP